MPRPPLPPAFVGYELDHVAIAVRDLDDAGVWLTLGFTPLGADEEVPDQGVRVRTLRAGASLLELVAPASPSSPIIRFLERRGPGLHHVALRVDDVELEIARLVEAGVRLIDATPRPGRAGTRVAFVHPSSTLGTLVELVEHP